MVSAGINLKGRTRSLDASEAPSGADYAADKFAEMDADADGCV